MVIGLERKANFLSIVFVCCLYNRIPVPVLVKASSPACLLATITTRHAKYDGTIDHKPADSLLPFSADFRRMEGVAHLQFLYAVMACAETASPFVLPTLYLPIYMSTL